MSTYNPKTPRAMFAMAAGALTAITLGVFVVMPATLDSGFDPAYTLAAGKPAAVGPVEVAIIPASIEVVGRHEPNVAWALDEPGKPNCRPQG
ncbi:MAG: hypothetical protein U1F15_03815 [Burkholderiales bacterium]